MTRRDPLLLALVLGLVPGAVRAQRAPDLEEPSPFIDAVGGLGLDEAITRARMHEPSLQAVRHDVDVARGRRDQSGARPNPSTSLEIRGEPGGTDSLVSIGVQWPLELLRDAGVDMETPEPVNAAMRRFGQLVEELDELV